MPNLPRYDSQRKLTTDRPAQLQSGSAEAVQSVTQPILSATVDTITKWNQAVDTIQMNAAMSNYNVISAQNQEAATNDPDYNNSKVYKDTLNKAKTEALKGIRNAVVRNEVAMKLSNKVALDEINLNKIFNFKMVDAAKAAISSDIDATVQKSLSSFATPTDVVNNIAELKETLDNSVNANVLTREKANEVYEKTLSQIRNGRVDRDSIINPKAVKDLLDTEYYGLTEEEKTKWRKIVDDRIKAWDNKRKQDEVKRKREFGNDLARRANSEFLKEGETLTTVSEVQAAVKNDEITASRAEALINYLTKTPAVKTDGATERAFWAESEILKSMEKEGDIDKENKPANDFINRLLTSNKLSESAKTSLYKVAYNLSVLENVPKEEADTTNWFKALGELLNIRTTSEVVREIDFYKNFIFKTTKTPEDMTNKALIAKAFNETKKEIVIENDPSVVGSEDPVEDAYRNSAIKTLRLQGKKITSQSIEDVIQILKQIDSQ